MASTRIGGNARGGGEGGASHLGGWWNFQLTAHGNGSVGRLYGGGGSGASNAQSQSTTPIRWSGAQGIIIVTPLYAPTGMAVAGLGYAPGEPVYYGHASTITFDKGSFPGAIAFQIEAQGGGGGGGGALATAATTVAAGGPVVGVGFTPARSFLLLARCFGSRAVVRTWSRWNRRQPEPMDHSAVDTSFGGRRCVAREASGWNLVRCNRPRPIGQIRVPIVFSHNFHW